MKWLFVTLLFANALFFGWSYTQNLRRDELNADYGISRTERADNSIALFSEMEQTPALQADASSDEWPPKKEGQQSPGKEQYELTGPIKQARNIEYEGDVSLLFELPTLESQDTICHRLGPLADSDKAEALLAWLQQHDIAYREHSPEEGQETSYWVYITPQKSVEELAELIDMLREQNIDNYRLVRSGKMRNALSLGNYGSIDEIDQRLAKIKEKGYEAIVIPQHSDKQARWFDVRIESHMMNEDFLEPFLARDDRFVTECAEADDWSS